jgi:hypothetical protein
MIQKEYWQKIETILDLKQQTKMKEKEVKIQAIKREKFVQKTEKISKMLSGELNSSFQESPILKKRKFEDMNNSQTNFSDLNDTFQTNESLSEDELDETKDEDISTLIDNDMTDETMFDQENFVPKENEENEQDHIIEEEEESNQNVKEEIKDLENDNNTPIEEILKKYNIEIPEKKDIAQDTKDLEDLSKNLEKETVNSFLKSATGRIYSFGYHCKNKGSFDFESRVKT